MKINPLTAIDFYKADHRNQYPLGTTEVYSNFTPRSNRLAKTLTNDTENKIVVFGLQYLVKHFLQDEWNTGFFNADKLCGINCLLLLMETNYERNNRLRI